ncbi:MAG: hypothetical protein EOM55_00790 [Clostridia bacterium]|nr:hypothetical protein [Clostridia bacterium]
MDISYLIPIFENNDAKIFFETFLSSKFFCEHKNVQILTYVAKSDEKNLKVLKDLSKKNSIIKVFIEEKTFSYNSVYKKAINIMKGDILLLGDAEIQNLDLIFSKCLEKYKLGANIVLVKKRFSGIKNFFISAFENFYNFVIKIFTGKKDRFNIISLGLYDKNVIDVFKTLPEKCCFLKNTKNLFGFSSRTIYIESKVKTNKLDFKKMTTTLLFAIISFFLSFVLFLTTLFLNVFLQQVPPEYNLFAIFGCIILLILASIISPKHFYNIRNND